MTVLELAPGPNVQTTVAYPAGPFSPVLCRLGIVGPVHWLCDQQHAAPERFHRLHYRPTDRRRARSG